MAIKTVTVCDARSSFEDCRRLADAKCAICSRDFCKEHLQYLLAVSCTVCDRRAEPQRNPDFCGADTLICERCASSIYGADKEAARQEMRKALDAVLVIMRAHWAAKALEKGE